jgi:hypothetical protein
METKTPLLVVKALTVQTVETLYLVQSHPRAVVEAEHTTLMAHLKVAQVLLVALAVVAVEVTLQPLLAERPLHLDKAMLVVQVKMAHSLGLAVEAEAQVRQVLLVAVHQTEVRGLRLQLLVHL